PEADYLAILVDGGGIDGSVNVYQTVRLGAEPNKSFVFSSLPSGPFRVRVLAFNSQTLKPLRTGRALPVSGGGTAAVVLGDVFEPYTTTPATQAAHGSRQTVSFRIADPGGWLEGQQLQGYASGTNSTASFVLPPLQNLSPSGSWDVSTKL